MVGNNFLQSNNPWFPSKYKPSTESPNFPVPELEQKGGGWDGGPKGGRAVELLFAN